MKLFFALVTLALMVFLWFSVTREPNKLTEKEQKEMEIEEIFGKGG